MDVRRKSITNKVQSPGSPETPVSVFLHHSFEGPVNAPTPIGSALFTFKDKPELFRWPGENIHTKFRQVYGKDSQKMEQWIEQYLNRIYPILGVNIEYHITTEQKFFHLIRALIPDSISRSRDETTVTPQERKSIITKIIPNMFSEVGRMVNAKYDSETSLSFEEQYFALSTFGVVSPGLLDNLMKEKNVQGEDLHHVLVFLTFVVCLIFFYQDPTGKIQEAYTYTARTPALSLYFIYMALLYWLTSPQQTVLVKQQGLVSGSGQSGIQIPPPSTTPVQYEKDIMTTFSNLNSMENQFPSKEFTKDILRMIVAWTRIHSEPSQFLESPYLFLTMHDNSTIYGMKHLMSTFNDKVTRYINKSFGVNLYPGGALSYLGFFTIKNSFLDGGEGGKGADGGDDRFMPFLRRIIQNKHSGTWETKFQFIFTQLTGDYLFSEMILYVDYLVALQTGTSSTNLKVILDLNCTEPEPVVVQRFSDDYTLDEWTILPVIAFLICLL